jgi:hypothetical protein
MQGISENRFQRGIGDRCFAAITTTSGYNNDIPTRVKLHALMQVYNEKLRENVRENLSGVYVVQAWPAAERYPSPHLVTNAFLTCDPARVDELLDAIVVTADSLRHGLFEDRYVSAAKATLKNIYDERIKTNSYWVDGIMNGISQDRSVDAFLSFPKYYDSIDRQTIIDAANMFLLYDTNMLKTIMLPEAKPVPDGIKPDPTVIQESTTPPIEPAVEGPVLIEIEVTPDTTPEAESDTN